MGSLVADLRQAMRHGWITNLPEYARQRLVARLFALLRAVRRWPASRPRAASIDSMEPVRHE